MEKHCRVVLCAAIFFFVTSGCLASPRIDEHPGRHWQCSETEFQCTSGQCVRIGALCDGDTDCDDKSDEEFCTFSNTENSLVNFVQRSKRQTARKCGKSKWTCRNGDCIAIDGKCDGAVDCQDGSDESYATCRNIKCPTYLFRCAYGACVDTTAKCDNVQDCRDNSDELNLDCKPRKASTKCGKRFECDDGKCIAPYERCDGVVNCADGSDETVLQCSKEVCPSYLFRCAYGACVDRGSDCNQIIECADGSDESYDLCNTAPPTTTEKPTTAAPTKPPFSGNGCIVPPLSAGNYKVETSENYSPGDEVPIFTVITFNCGSGSSLPGNQNVTYCIGPNSWSSEPVCKRKCRALQSVSVSFKCSAPDGKILPCDVPVEVGTIARPTCKNSYIHRDILPQLKCLEGGSWDNTASCTPGVTKTGFKIVFLVTDRVQFYVATFDYPVPVDSASASEPGTVVMSNSIDELTLDPRYRYTGPFNLSDLVSYASMFQNPITNPAYENDQSMIPFAPVTPISNSYDEPFTLKNRFADDAYPTSELKITNTPAKDDSLFDIFNSFISNPDPASENANIANKHSDKPAYTNGDIARSAMLDCLNDKNHYTYEFCVDFVKQQSEREFPSGAQPHSSYAITPDARVSSSPSNRFSGESSTPHSSARTDADGFLFSD